MFHSMLFTTADNILMLSAWVDVQYREQKLCSWLPLYNKQIISQSISAFVMQLSTTTDKL